MSKEKYYHDKGQRDASNGEYKKPHSTLNNIFSSATSRLDSENKAYSKGWKHGNSQKKK